MMPLFGRWTAPDRWWWVMLLFFSSGPILPKDTWCSRKDAALSKEMPEGLFDLWKCEEMKILCRYHRSLTKMQPKRDKGRLLSSRHLDRLTEQFRNASPHLQHKSVSIIKCFQIMYFYGFFSGFLIVYAILFNQSLKGNSFFKNSIYYPDVVQSQHLGD